MPNEPTIILEETTILLQVEGVQFHLTIPTDISLVEVAQQGPPGPPGPPMASIDGGEF